VQVYGVGGSSGDVVEHAGAASGSGLGSLRGGRFRCGSGGGRGSGALWGAGDCGTHEVGGDVAPVGHGSGCNVSECAGGDLYGCGCHNLAFVLLFAVSNYAFLLLLSSYNFAFL
jgi:hypothetical protein